MKLIIDNDRDDTIESLVDLSMAYGLAGLARIESGERAAKACRVFSYDYECENYFGGKSGIDVLVAFHALLPVFDLAQACRTFIAEQPSQYRGWLLGYTEQLMSGRG